MQFVLDAAKADIVTELQFPHFFQFAVQRLNFAGAHARAKSLIAASARTFFSSSDETRSIKACI